MSYAVRIALLVSLLAAEAAANPHARSSVNDAESTAVRMAGLLTATEGPPPRWAEIVDAAPEPQRDLHPHDETPPHLATETISIATVPLFERVSPQTLVPGRISLSFVLRGR